MQESLAQVQTLATNPYVLHHSAFVDQVRLCERGYAV